MSQILEKKPGCIQSALSIIGDKWTARLIHTMWHEPKRFSELQHELTGISPRTLSQRLAKLEEHAVIEKVEVTVQPLVFGYQLTTKGADFAGILQQMARWGEKYYQPSAK